MNQSGQQRTRGSRRGLSLVEVAMALGIVSFALLSLLALLPVAIKVNQTSAEEARAIQLLSLLEADLRNTHPDANGGRSSLFRLALPYRMKTAQSGVALNTSLSLNTLGSANTTGLDDAMGLKSIGEPARYQATVIYTRAPQSSVSGVIQARLIVNWPAIQTSDPAQLTSLQSTRGFVETSVIFPAP